MKIFLLLMFTLSVYADIEFAPDEEAKPTVAEVQRNRSCFTVLEVFGCGTPTGDMNYFRTCLHDSFPSLSAECKGLMSDLYGTGGVTHSP